MTTFAAFTALIVFVSGIIGVAVGRWRIDRNARDEPEKHHGLGATGSDADDTDVFSAVRDDDSPDRRDPRQPGAQTEERTVVGGHRRA